MIPNIPAMTALDEEWVEWAAGTAGITPEMARGLLAGFYTMRARAYPMAIDRISADVQHGYQCLAELPAYEREYPREVIQDREMWNALLPQLQAMAR